MSITVKLRRGTTTQHSSFTGQEAEVTVDTTKDVVVVHDGVTVGGHPMAKASSLATVATSGDYNDLVNIPPAVTVTGTSPVVSSGGATPDISLASGYGDTQNPYASKTANNFLAAPNGSAGVPTFRALVAADVPTLNQNTTGTASNVTGTVAIANGGTGATTAAGALTNLGAYAASNPSGYITSSGTAANVSGVVAIANGGTGQTTRQAAMDALAGSVTSGQYLRGDGTDVVMSAIQAADVPTLNQNTTGTAANVTGIVAVANGGTGTATPSLVAGTNITISGTFPNQTINSTGGGGVTIDDVIAFSIAL